MGYIGYSCFEVLHQGSAYMALQGTFPERAGKGHLVL